MSLRSFVLVAALIGLPAAPAAAQATVPDSLALSRQYIAWFYAGEVDSLRAHMTDAFRTDMPPEKLNRLIQMVASRAGVEQHVLEERFVRRNGDTQYWRMGKFSVLGELFLIRWVIGPEGRLDGIGLGPASQAPPIDPEPAG